MLGRDYFSADFAATLTLRHAETLLPTSVGSQETHGAAGAFNVNLPLTSILIGDTTANGSVNSSDIGQTKSYSEPTAPTSNFRSDVTVNTSINTSDIGLEKSKSGTNLP